MASSTQSPINNYDLPVSVTFSGPATWFDITDITVSGGTKPSFSGSGAQYSFTINPTVPTCPSAAQLVSVNIPANVAQYASNPSVWNKQSNTLTWQYDHCSPEDLGVTCSPQFTNTGSVSLTMKGRDDTQLSYYKLYRASLPSWTWVDLGTVFANIIAGGQTDTSTYVDTLPAVGNYNYDTHVYDAAGNGKNAGSADSCYVCYDNQVPTENSPVCPAAYVQSNPTFTLSGTDTGCAGVKEFKLYRWLGDDWANSVLAQTVSTSG